MFLNVPAAEAERIKDLFRYAIELNKLNEFYSFIGDGEKPKKGQAWGK